MSEWFDLVWIAWFGCNSSFQKTIKKSVFWNMLDWLFNIGALFTKQNISIHFAKNTDMKICYQVLRMRQYVEKLTGYHGEWSPLGSPKAKLERPQAQRFCPPDFPKDSIYYDTLKPFPHIFILLSSWTSITSSKEGFFFIQCNGLSRE